MEKPYTQFINKFTSIKGPAKFRHTALDSLFKGAFDGEFGPKVKWSLFGLGDLETFRPDTKKMKDMAFYAKALEGWDGKTK